MERKRFDGYGRVSRRGTRTGPGYISPQVQRDGVDRWAAAYDVTIDQWHFDEDKTGRNQNRPGMREVVRRIEAGEVEGVVCLKLNRFARNVVGALQDVQRIQAAGGEIVFVEEQIATSGATGQLMLTLMLAFAEWEHENYAANFREAKRRAVNRGAYVSRTPFGYQRRADGTLTPHPTQGPIVAEAFRLAGAHSLQAALGYLEKTVPERRWTTTTVRRVISGRSYLGETRSGPTIKPGTHEPLVSRAIWEAAQSAPSKRQPSASFPLSGLARCGTCGAPMVGGRGGTGQRTYRCSGTLSTSRSTCPHGAVITASILEDHVRAQARELLAGLRATISDPEADTLTLLERAITDAEAELDAFAADMTLRRALGNRYHAHLESRVENMEQARAAYRKRAREAQTRLTLRSPDIIDGDDPRLLALLLRGIFDSIVVTPGRGLKAGERVRLVPIDADGPSGVAGSEGS